LARNLAVSTPMSTGDIVGRSFRIFRQNILLIGKILVLPTILMCLGRVGVVVGSTYGFKLMSEPANGVIWFILAALGGTVLIAGALILWLRSLALVRYLTGFSTSYQDAEPFVVSRIWSLIGLGLASGAASMVVLIIWGVLMALSIPSLKAHGLVPIIGSFGLATSLLGLTTSLIFLSLVYNLVGTAVALEPKDRDLGSLIGEGLTLTFKSFWRSLGFLLVTVTSVSVVAYPMTLPMVILIAGYMIMQGVAGNVTAEPTLPMYIQVINAVWETVVNMLISPIYYLAYALYYCDLRMRQHGVDLIERIDAVAEEDASGKLSSHGI